MAWLPFAALALDLLIPDPKRLPHPVQAIGRLADFLEPRIRKLPNPVLAGGMALSAILLLTGWAAFMLTILPFGLSVVFSLYLAWSGLALGSLVKHGAEALHAIHRAESTPDSLLIFQARRDVQKLVSRNTQDMDISNLYRSLAESLSENFNDAFVAPFFWLCLGGPVGLWLYKAASTMDSMWGYRNARFEKLGKASARLDDVLAFIPARLSALFLVATANGLALLARRFPALKTVEGAATLGATWPGWKEVIAQARQSKSPNAGYPMATAAWLCAGKNGGPTRYDGKIVNKPLMGPDSGRWTNSNTRSLLGLVRASALTGGVFMALMALVPLLL